MLVLLHELILVLEYLLPDFVPLLFLGFLNDVENIRVLLFVRRYHLDE